MRHLLLLSPQLSKQIAAKNNPTVHDRTATVRDHAFKAPF
jgi:hypothetical protein